MKNEKANCFKRLEPTLCSSSKIFYFIYLKKKLRNYRTDSKGETEDETLSDEELQNMKADFVLNHFVFSVLNSWATKYQYLLHLNRLC